MVLQATAGSAGVPGTVDARFGNGGRALGPLYVSDLASAPDGHLVTLSPDGLCRVDADGALDTSFGGTGCIPERGSLLAVQDDGKPLLAEMNLQNLRLARYRLDGTLDPTFGSAGTVHTALPALSGMTIDATGRIVITTGAALRRFLPDGSVDGTFGTGGEVDLVVPGYLVLTEPDDRIVTAGVLDLSGAADFAIARYEEDGTPDASFGTGGVATYDFGGYDIVGDVRRQPDGHLLLAGLTAPDPQFSAGDIAMARFLSDGTLDPAFGTNGAMTDDLGGMDSVQKVVVQADGRIVALGGIALPGSVLPLLARYLPDGTPDAAFGSGGRIISTANGRVAIAGQSDGRLVIGGAEAFGDPRTGRFAGTGLVRFFAGVCGDGVTDAGEDCDDGNLVPDDGCDPSCCVADADHDGLCDAVDPCTSPTPASKPKITVSHANALPSDAGAQTLTVGGEATLPFPFDPPLDPVAHGARVVVTDAAGRAVDLRIPGGAFDGGTGWKVSTTGATTRWKFVPVRFSDIPKTTLSTKAQAPGRVKVVVQLRANYMYLASALPLSAEMVLGPPIASAGQCASLTFRGPAPLPSCTLVAGGATVRCK